MVRLIFPKGEEETGTIQTNDKGGKAYFISYPTGHKLREIIHQMEITFDVNYPINEDIRYIHKVVDDYNIFYFANIGSTHIETQVVLRGNINIEGWDPLTGGSQKLLTDCMNDNVSGLSLTNVKLNLKPYHSCFWVEKKQKSN